MEVNRSTYYYGSRWISSWTISTLNPLAAEQERQVLASVTLQILNSGAAAPGEIPGEK